MTISSTIEIKIAGRQASSAPADAAAKVLGVKPKAEAEKARFATVVHWAYGTAWGALRSVLGAAGPSGPVAGGAHFAAVWGSGLVLPPRLGVAPPVGKWGTKRLRRQYQPCLRRSQPRLDTCGRHRWDASLMQSASKRCHRGARLLREPGVRPLLHRPHPVPLYRPRLRPPSAHGRGPSCEARRSPATGE